MEEIYWIQRLGTISLLAGVFCTLSFVTLILFGIFMLIEGEDNDFDNSYSRLKKAFKTSFYTFILSLPIWIFTPSRDELYAIYGVGGVIDYVKSNDTAKQIPDKAIKALDKWIDDTLEKDNHDDN